MSNESYSILKTQLKEELKRELKAELKTELLESYFADFGRGAATKILYLFGALLLVLIGASGTAEKLVAHVLK